MFNSYNDAPLISYTEFDQGGEKKQDNVPKWSYGHSGSVQVQNNQSDYWTNKSNVIGISAPLHVPSKCNCSECYSSEANSYQGDSTRNRTWLPRRVAVPVNNSNDSCKLPGTHQWNNLGLLNSETCMIESGLMAAQHAQDSGGKNSYHRPFPNANPPEFHKTGVITSVKTFPSSEGHILLKNKDEISSNSAVQEMTFYGQNHNKQPSLGPPTYDLIRNLEKRLDAASCDSNYCDLNDKYSNINSYRHSNSVTSYPLDSYISRPPTAEPYLKAVPLNLNQNRVPSIGHRNLKENLPKSCIDESLLRCNNGPRKLINSEAFQGSIERNIFQSPMAKDGLMADNFRGEQLHGLPSSMVSDCKNHQVLVDYSHFTMNRDLPKHYENGTEAAEMQKKLLLERDRQIDYFPRNNLSDGVKRNGQNSLQENKKDCTLNQINQINSAEQQYRNFNGLNIQNSSGSKYLEVDSSKASVPVFYPKDPNVDKVLKPNKCDSLQPNPVLIQRNEQNLLKNQNPRVNARLNRPPLFVNDSQDFRFVERRQNSFPYQNNAMPYRNLVHPQYSYQGYNIPNVPQYPHPFDVNNFFRNDGNPMNHINEAQGMPNCKPTNPSFIPSGNNAFVIHPYCQAPQTPNFDKTQTQQIYNGNQQLPLNTMQMYSHVPQPRAEEPRIENSSEPKNMNHVEAIKSQTFNKNGNSKISPLRLLRKKKVNNQKNEIMRKSPVPKTNPETMTPALDVRKFWSTWADEEEDNSAPTGGSEMVVLDCQNINPEQAELLQLYENGAIQDLNSENNSMVGTKSSGCDKRYVYVPPSLDAKEININCNGFHTENDIKMDNCKFSKDINQNQLDIIKENDKLKLEKLDEKSSATSSNLFLEMSGKNEAGGNTCEAVMLQNAIQENKESSGELKLGDDIKIGETDFVEKVDFLKMAGLSKDSLENDEADKIKYEGNEFSFNLDRPVSSKVKSSEDEPKENEAENNLTGMNECVLPEKVQHPGMKLGKPVNETNDDQPLNRLSPFDDDSLSSSPYSGKCDFPNLPTSEYRRNKFLDYSDGKYIVNGGVLDSAEADKIMKLNEGNKGCSEKVVGSGIAEKITVNPTVSKDEVLNEKNMKRECPTKNSGTLLDKYACDELGKSEFQCFKNESVINDLKPKQETGLHGFEMDNILQKLSKINFCGSEVKVEGATNGSEMETTSEKAIVPKEMCPSDKKIKKNKKIENEVDGFERTDTVTLEKISLSKPTIKFSIQKNHDLKISFKVLNNQLGGTKCEKIQIDEEIKGERNESDKSGNSLEDTRTKATELITLKLKSVQKDDWVRNGNSNSGTEFRDRHSHIKRKSKHKLKRRKTTENDSYPLKGTHFKVKRNKYLTIKRDEDNEKETLVKAANYDSDHLPNSKPDNCLSQNDFKVKESIDSAKIKLTFKRQKGNSLADYEINDFSRELESEDQSNSSNDLSSEGEKTFLEEKPETASSNLDSLSVSPSGSQFSKSESKFASTQIDSESTSEENKSYDPPGLPGENYEDDNEKIVRYSNSFSGCQFAHSAPDNGETKESVEKEKSPGTLMNEKMEENTGSEKCFGVSETIISDVFGEAKLIADDKFSKENANLMGNNETAENSAGKRLINSENVNKYDNKYCKSTSLLSDPDTLMEHETQPEVRFDGLNSKNPKDLLNELTYDNEKRDELNGTIISENTRPETGEPFPPVVVEGSRTEDSWPNQKSTNDLHDDTTNNKKEMNVEQELNSFDEEEEDKSLKSFERLNWSNTKAEKNKKFCHASKYDNDLVFDNDYSSSVLGFGDVIEEKKSEKRRENEKNSHSVKDESNEKIEFFQWNVEPPLKPMGVDTDISMDNSLFASEDPLPGSDKNETGNALEKRWMDTFNAENHSDESENNSFEFIINSSGKIVTSDCKKIPSYTAPEHTKIDEINNALEAFFHASEKNTDDTKNTSQNPDEKCLNKQREPQEQEQHRENPENINEGTHCKDYESPLGVSNAALNDSDSNVSHGNEVKDQNEITDSKCDSVISKPEEKSEILEEPNEKNDTFTENENCEKNKNHPSLNADMEVNEIKKLVNESEEEFRENLERDVKSFSDSENDSSRKDESIESNHETMSGSPKINLDSLTPKHDEFISKSKQDSTKDEECKLEDQKKGENKGKNGRLYAEHKKDFIVEQVNFDEPQKRIGRRHSDNTENKLKTLCNVFNENLGGACLRKNAYKIKFSYSKWKSQYPRAKSCPPIAFNLKNGIRIKTPILDIPVEDIPLPPGDAPPENCFDLMRYLKKRKLSVEHGNGKQIEPLNRSSKIMKTLSDEETVSEGLLTPSQHDKVHIETNNNEYIFQGEISRISDSGDFSISRCNFPRCSLSNFNSWNKNTDNFLINNKIGETDSSDKDTFCGLNQDLSEMKVTKSGGKDNSDNLSETLVSEESNKSPTSKAESCFIKICSNSQLNEPKNLEKLSESFTKKEEWNINHKALSNVLVINENEISNNMNLGDESDEPDKTEVTEVVEELSNFVNGDGSSAQELSEWESLHLNSSENLEAYNPEHDLEKTQAKSTCPETEREDTETINSDKVDLMDGESADETSFHNDALIKDGFYECEDIPTSEDLPNGNIEMEKVSDDAKFRHMMQNCLDNAKKFLNVSSLKLFSCSVDDLLELDCPPENTASEEKITRDVLLTPYDDLVSNDLDLSQKFPLSDLSLDIVPSFVSENSSNLCPEILPVDNWPYLEEEVPLSPSKSNLDESDLVPFLENSPDVETSRQKQCDSKIVKDSFRNISNKKGFSSPRNSEMKKFRRKSLFASDETFLKTKSRINEKRRKTVDGSEENGLLKPKKLEEINKGLETKVTELKNGLIEIESLLQNTQSLKCRLNLNRLIGNLEEKNNPRKIDACPNEDGIDKTLENFKSLCNNEKKHGRYLVEVDSTENSTDKSKESQDYSGPKWQPKVMLFRISTKDLKKYEKKNQTENWVEMKNEKNGFRVSNKYSLDEREKISQDIVRVLESQDVPSSSTLGKCNASTNLEVTGRCNTAISEKSNPKKSEMVLENKVQKSLLPKKEESNLMDRNSVKVADDLACNKHPSHENTTQDLNKTLKLGENLHSVNHLNDRDRLKRKKTRFRNLHDNRKPKLIKINDKNNKDPTTRSTMGDTERRLCEIFKDCIDTTERIANVETKEILSTDEKFKKTTSKDKKQFPADNNVFNSSRKKRKSVEKESNSRINGDNHLHSKSNLKKESSFKYDKKQSKNHVEKSLHDSSRHSKSEECRSSKHNKESHRNHKDKPHTKQAKGKNEIPKEEKVRRSNSVEKHLKIKDSQCLPNYNELENNNKCSKAQKKSRGADPTHLLSEESENDDSETPWMCEVCGFNNANERIGHIKGHPFHCQSCHLAFRTESHFVDHLTKKHKDIRNQHHCLLCELSFDTEKEYQQHLETREHIHLDTVEKNTINTLFTLLTGQPCPVFGLLELRPEWLPNQAGTVHFYHQATPLSLALQYLKMHHDLSSYSKDSSSHSS